jgi:hypothetical protein
MRLSPLLHAGLPGTLGSFCKTRGVNRFSAFSGSRKGVKAEDP